MEEKTKEICQWGGEVEVLRNRDALVSEGGQTRTVWNDTVGFFFLEEKWMEKEKIKGKCRVIDWQRRGRREALDEREEGGHLLERAQRA